MALRAGLAALAMGGLALAIWPGALAPQGTRAEAPPETPAPAPRGSRPDHPFGPDLVQEVRRELREAGELAVDAEGHLRPLPQGPLPAGWRELVDPDPVRWPALRQNLGVLLEVDAWRAQGGQVERLPRATDARLAAADRLFAQALLPEPFAGLRGLAPTRTPESFDQLLDPGFLAPARVPEDLTGWMGAALRARRQIADARQQLKDEVAAYARTGVASPYLPTDLMPAVPLLLTHPKTLIREGFFRPQSRVHIRRWMAPGVAALRRLMLATARALAPGQPERARRAAALRGLLSGGTLFLFSELSFVDLPTVTGLDPQDDLHAHVLVGLERDAAKVRREVQDEREPAWLVPALERLSRRPIREIEDAFFVAHAGREQVERWRAAGQPEAALRAYRQALATLGEHDAGPPLGQLHTQAILTWLDAAPALAATPAERAVVTTFLRGHPQLRPSAGEPRQRAAEIDAWLAAEG